MADNSTTQHSTGRRSTSRRFFRRSLGIVVFVLSFLWGAASSAQPSPLESASTGGLASLDRALARLATHERLLVIAAHPDDEDTRVLTHVARGRGGEAAYLSLSRGEGGQNLIGDELGVGLGLLRSRELQAARGIDGARQFFSRAYDFGYTRSIDETFRRWPREILLKDAVRVIRRFKPQVIVAVFPPDSRAGHGQHQASGIIAREAFDAAGDPEMFPELAEEGLFPWKPATFFQSAWMSPDSATHQVPLGQIDPFSGLSIYQISSLSRSQHRCQDMGRELPLGDASARLAWERGVETSSDEDIFAGVDTRLQAITAPLPEGSYKRSIVARLGRIEALALQARAEIIPSKPGSSVAPLLEIIRLLRTTKRNLSEDGLSEAGRVDPNLRRQAVDLIDEKLEIAQEAVFTAAHLTADAFTDQEIVVPGSEIEVNAVFWNAGSNLIDDLEVRHVETAVWTEIERSTPSDDPRRAFFSTKTTDEQVLTLQASAEASPSVPYFLREELQGDVYSWETAAPLYRGEPFEAPPLSLVFTFELDSTPVKVVREVVQRTRDQARGEVRRPLRIVPRLEVEIEPELVIWPIGAREKQTLRAAVTSNDDEPISTRLEIAVPEGWPAIDPIPVELEARGRAVFEVELSAPADFAEGRFEAEAAALIDRPKRMPIRFEHSWPVIDYEHVRPTMSSRPATVAIAADEIALPSLERVGYVRGASDRMPEKLRQIGVPIELLDDDLLRDGDLSRYDVIVVGSRAYETNPLLGRVNGRLLDYARAGGTLIVQYQQYQFSRGGFAPYPFEISRPHDRVTDETAAVTLLDPEHPVFTTPNRLDEGDWDGWVQERGLYFGGTVDDAYTPLLAMADPGGDEKRGALLIAELGEGRYVYTGLAFFRQLPAGVTGAYRLFANLLAVGQ